MKMNGMVRTTPFTFFGRSNRVEHQKLNQVAAGSSRAATRLSFWCLTRPSADTGTDQDQKNKKRKSATSYTTI